MSKNIFKQMKLLKTIAFIVVTSTTTFGQSIITDRPDQTESSSTISVNNLQIEAGLQYTEVPGSDELLAPSVLFRYGLIDILELRLVTEFTTIKNELTKKSINGLTDIQLGMKVQLLKKEGAPEIAFLSHVVIPTAKDALSAQKTGVINKLSIAHNLFKKISIGYNIGYDNFGEGSGNFTYSLAIGTSISDKIGMYIEPFGEFTDFNKSIANFDFGFTYLFNKNLQADISYGTGLNNSMNYYSTGISYRIQ